MVANVGGYRWSSFLANATGHENVMIAPHPAYQKLRDTQAARAYAYRKSFEEDLKGVDRSAIEDEILSATTQPRSDGKAPRPLEEKGVCPLIPIPANIPGV